MTKNHSTKFHPGTRQASSFELWLLVIPFRTNIDGYMWPYFGRSLEESLFQKYANCGPCIKYDSLLDNKIWTKWWRTNDWINQQSPPSRGQRKKLIANFQTSFAKLNDAPNMRANIFWAGPDVHRCPVLCKLNGVKWFVHDVGGIFIWSYMLEKLTAIIMCPSERNSLGSLHVR